MKVYVVIRVVEPEYFNGIFPEVLSIKPTLQEAIQVIADEFNIDAKYVEAELDENNCYDSLDARYTIVKYFD